jgi:hypothetical protein
MKIPPMGAELSHADGRTDKTEDITNLIRLFAVLQTPLKMEVGLYKLARDCWTLKMKHTLPKHRGTDLCVISGFRRSLNEIFALLECYAA